MAGPRRWGGQDLKGRSFQPRRCRLSILSFRGASAPRNLLFLSFATTCSAAYLAALNLDGNLLQLLYRDRGAFPAPPRHVAAAFAARLGADGDLEGCGHPTRSRAARY